MLDTMHAPGVDDMRSGDVALRLSIVFAVAGSLALAAGLYEIDRREKSSSETVTANLTEIEQRVQVLSNQIRILNDQYTRQLTAGERQVQALSTQIQALESRLKELEDDLRVRRLESGPVRR
jgi:septal ring factor EnvC (AmiA/AmiB activator)